MPLGRWAAMPVRFSPATPPSGARPFWRMVEPSKSCAASAMLAAGDKGQRCSGARYGPVVTVVGPVWIMGVAPLTAIAEVGFWIVFLKMYTLVAATTGSEAVAMINLK